MGMLSPDRMTWFRLLRPGDWGMVVAGGALAVGLFLWLPQRGAPSHAVVRLSGEIVARLPLDRPTRYAVRGPLGVTEIEVAPGKARVVRDPSPRQLCVWQGWLTRAGSMAICAPNEVSLALEGGEPTFDSLTF